MRILIFICLLSSFGSYGQNYWPKNYIQPKLQLYDIIEDNDGGYLALTMMNNDGNSYLLKFDANANLLWKKCLNYKVNPALWAIHFIKDRFKNLYIVGASWDTDPLHGDAFVLKLDSCYNKVKCVVYTDTVYKEQQYVNWNIDFSDSLFFMAGWGFNRYSNQFIVVNKSNLLPKKVFNTPANSFGISYSNNNNGIYVPTVDRFYLQGGDTTEGAVRTAVLKLDKQSGDEVLYKFFGFEENLLSMGLAVFKNRHNSLNIFGVFRMIVNDNSYKDLSPILFECDTNLNLIKYQIYNDWLIDQNFDNVAQLNDSTYMLAITYRELGATQNSSEKIKLYKMNESGKLVDSFYLNSLGHTFYTEGGIRSIKLLKTFDNKMMCVFLEKDIDFKNPRITFLKFDENFKLDTTEYRNKKYDINCTILNDSINLADADICYLSGDSIFPLLELKKPLGIIPVPEKYKIAFYPNPITTTATFEFENFKADELKINLVDAKGAFVKEIYFSEKANQGKNEIKLNFDAIPTGLYFLTVYLDSNLKHTIKIIKE